MTFENHTDPRKPLYHYFLLTFTLFCLFAATMNLAGILHELGHVVGCYLANVKSFEITLRPFSASMVSADMGNATPIRHIIYHGSGVVFGTIFVLPLLIVYRTASPRSLLWLIGTAVFAFEMLINANYLLLGAVKPFGDAQGVIVYGELILRSMNGWPVIPRILVFFLGIPSLYYFCVFGAQILTGLGLRKEDGLRNWLVVGLGIPAYFPLMIVYNAIVRPHILDELPQHFIVMTCMTLGVLGVVALAYRNARGGEVMPDHSLVTRTAVLFGLACLVVGGELILFP
jgi:hypothetical protein